jgi:glyoxylase-like metal-dependent hydrolase (beta-lactamase superfamily II)
MAEVKVLVKGYTNFGSGEEERTCPTMSLVKDKNIIMVTDPGVIKDKKILIDALKKEGVSIEKVNYVFLTHPHPDHFFNVGMFPNVKLVESFGIWYKDGVEDWNENFSEDIKIIKTPGHDSSSLSLLVKTSKGIVAIVGDVFWKENYPEVDPYASKPGKLKESREIVLKSADYIVPGHGDMFKVKK